MDGASERLLWVRSNQDLVDRLDARWPGWEQEGEGGLAAYLYQQDDWADQDQWDDERKVDLLHASLDQWYAEESASDHEPEADAEADTDPLAWVAEDPALVERLDWVWPSWRDPGESGLLATLAATAEWSGYEMWDGETQRTYLTQTLDAWYPSVAGSGEDEEAEAEQAEADEGESEEGQPEDGTSEETLETVAQAAEQELAGTLEEVLSQIDGAAELTDEELREVLLELLTQQEAGSGTGQ